MAAKSLLWLNVSFGKIRCLEGSLLSKASRGALFLPPEGATVAQSHHGTGVEEGNPALLGRFEVLQEQEGILVPYLAQELATLRTNLREQGYAASAA